MGIINMEDYRALYVRKEEEEYRELLIIVCHIITNRFGEGLRTHSGFDISNYHTYCEFWVQRDKLPVVHKKSEKKIKHGNKYVSHTYFCVDLNKSNQKNISNNRANKEGEKPRGRKKTPRTERIHKTKCNMNKDNNKINRHRI